MKSVVYWRRTVHGADWRLLRRCDADRAHPNTPSKSVHVESLASSAPRAPLRGNSAGCAPALEFPLYLTAPATCNNSAILYHRKAGYIGIEFVSCWASRGRGVVREACVRRRRDRRRRSAWHDADSTDNTHTAPNENVRPRDARPRSRVIVGRSVPVEHALQGSGRVAREEFEQKKETGPRRKRLVRGPVLDIRRGSLLEGNGSKALCTAPPTLLLR